MANTDVGRVLDKIDHYVSKEGEILEKVERVEFRLRVIREYLRDADLNYERNVTVHHWLLEVREVIYHLEDAIDKSTLKIHELDQLQKYPRFLQKLIKKLCIKPLKVCINYKLGTDLDNILKKLNEIFKSTTTCGIRNEPQIDESKEEAGRMPFQRTVYEEIDETEVVDMQAHKNNILKLLLSREETPRRAVITIVGTGGLGKTTLACMVYKSARADFEYHIMLSISQHFRLIDLLREMLHQLKYDVHENQDVGDLTSELKEILSSKRYLIIVDDVWQVNMWNQLKVALPDVDNGSRVLMTSRFRDVATSADPNTAPYELNFLNDNDSLDLLLKTALRTYQEYPSNLLELAHKFSKKCKGLPLALLVVGAILATKGRDYSKWEKVLQTWDWHSNDKCCMGVLALSYKDMHYCIKACFLYLASFPENYEISPKRLIRMWAAEGFLESYSCDMDTFDTVEERGAYYLQELYNRSLIQVSSRYKDGSIMCFQVHILHHELAMQEARKESFVKVFSEASDVMPNKRVRRASLQSCSQQFMENVDPNIRSLLWFGPYLPNCSDFRLLNVLELVGITTDDPDLVRRLVELTQLKYLGFRNCEIPFSPRSFQRMKTLQTLDVRGTRAELPDDLWEICTLRHVLCDCVLNGPVSAAQLKNIQTMQWIWPRRTWVDGWMIPNLCNLRKLGVCWGGEWTTTIKLFRWLPKLVSLGIKGSLNKTMSLPEEIVYPTKLLDYQNLQSLHLQGKWSTAVTLDASLFPEYLVKLTLVDSELEQNPMLELGKLKNLKKLCLRHHVMNYSDQISCSEGFPELQYLQVVGSNIKNLGVSPGVMPKLIHLQLQTPIHFEFQLPLQLQNVTVQYFGSTFEGKDQICKQFSNASFN